MALMFNSLLSQYALDPANTILLRHQDSRAARGRTPYELWRDNRPAFDRYQSTQRIKNRDKFSRASVWASFVGTPNGETMLVGIYEAKYAHVITEDTPWPHADGIDLAGTCDLYELHPDQRLADLRGKLFIEWGEGLRSWVQRADRQNKAITELRPEFKEPDFPGFLNLIEPLSKIAGFPKSWIEALKHASGVYLLTCPKTKEQYVGSAYGDEGFWHRWMEYVTTGHGGNVSLKSREPSDYQISILEIAGSSAQVEDILNMEVKWKVKLQSREMGLNKN
ncbi:MAG: GIY-YIG nuclease family protein [Acidocella sp.]|nr:GIY-YIG nuclease family protein [Acidocella sp.]